MIEGSSVHEHGLKMIGLIEKLAFLDAIMDNDLCIDLILQSLLILFNQFIMNFNMSKLEVTINELVNMLVTIKATIKKEKPVILASTPKARKNKVGKRKKGGVADFQILFKGKNDQVTFCWTSRACHKTVRINLYRCVQATKG
ncbi:hypothetical protein CDL12_03246 [Handroanthus impetiginosus]|uniref:Uncharacterized protein n=1 Tax=Handroanthus impetiginosus TaxID=429701 RepID=A0A2G9I2Q4_9LAMI|nr:hypothetical protein CDL12_03246 [Handroanthus impetiginosus]